MTEEEEEAFDEAVAELAAGANISEELAAKCVRLFAEDYESNSHDEEYQGQITHWNDYDNLTEEEIIEQRRSAIAGPLEDDEDFLAAVEESGLSEEELLLKIARTPY